MAAAPRQPLSREAIVRSAIGLVDREGLEALNMRRLAGELGVGTMTLYGYFRHKDELIRAIIETLADAGRLPDPADAWRDRLADLMRHLYRGLMRHPGLARLRVLRPVVTPGAFRLTEAAIEALRSAGFTASEAAMQFRTLFVFTFGVAVFNPRESAEAAHRDVGAALGGLPRDEYPELTNAIPELLESLDADAQFEHGLALILDAIERAAQ